MADPFAGLDTSQRLGRLTSAIRGRDPELAAAIEQLAGSGGPPSELARNQAIVDAMLAFRAADAAQAHASAADKTARGLLIATWALVTATVVLALVALFGGGG